MLSHLVWHWRRCTVRHHHTGLGAHRLVRCLRMLAIGRRGGSGRKRLVLLVLSVVHLLLVKLRRLAIETALLIVATR